jgi:hypothetical protein
MHVRIENGGSDPVQRGMDYPPYRMAPAATSTCQSLIAKRRGLHSAAGFVDASGRVGEKSVQSCQGVTKQDHQAPYNREG